MLPGLQYHSLELKQPKRNTLHHWIMYVYVLVEGNTKWHLLQGKQPTIVE